MVAKVTVTMLLLIIVSYLIKIMSPHLFNYLLSDVWGEQITHLVTLVSYVFLVVLCAYILLNVIDINLELTGNAVAKSSAWILMVYFLGSGILYACKYYGVDLRGYSNIGIVSGFFIILIFLGAMYSIFDGKKEEQKK